MADRYLSKLIRRNWRFLLGGIFIVLLVGFVFKNVGEIPYENQHLMHSSLPVKFEHQGETIRGFLYVFYWVESDPAEVKGMSDNELGDYLFDNGRLNLEQVKGDLISFLKNSSPAEIREKYYSDYQYFKMRDFYFVKSDPRLEEFVRGYEFNIPLSYTLKKVFFIYIDEEEFPEADDAL